MLQQKLPKAVVRSAGIGALSGHPADETVCRIAAEQSISLASHRAAPIDVRSTRLADLILCMEPHHLEAVLTMDPTARGKTFLLGHWMSTSIADPYRRPEDVYRNTHQEIATAVSTWLERLDPDS